ncbi:MAG: acyl dehydratase [Solirubrobacterales bacterium]|nr:acyl dehydratase [Solirubrobacterales bacterium]
MSAPVAGSAVQAGERLPPFTLVLTLQRLVMEAAANRDFAALHHDPEAARASGAGSVYMNTTFVETLLEAVVRSWAGLDAWIRVIEFAMKDFNCAGDVVSAAGVVTSAGPDGGELVAEVDLWVESHRGRTVTGRAVVAFPADGARPAPGA